MEVKRFYGLLLGLVLILGITGSAMGQIAGMVVRVSRPDSGKIVAIDDSIVVEVSNTLSSLPDAVQVRVVQATSASDTITTRAAIDSGGVLATPYTNTTKWSRSVDGTLDATNGVVSSISALSASGVKTYRISFTVQAGNPEKLSNLAVIATVTSGGVATQLHSNSLAPAVAANSSLGLIGNRKPFGIDGERPVITGVNLVYLDAGIRPTSAQMLDDGTASVTTNRGWIPRKLANTTTPFRFGYKAGETMGVNIVLTSATINAVAAGTYAGAVVLVDTLLAPGLADQTKAKIRVPFLASALLSSDTTKSATDTTSTNQMATRHVALSYAGSSIARRAVTVASGAFGNTKSIQAQVFLIDSAGNLSGTSISAATATGVTSALTYLADTVLPVISSVYPDTTGKRFTGLKSITADTMNSSGVLLASQRLGQRPVKWTLSEIADSMTVKVGGRTFVRGSTTTVQASGTDSLDAIAETGSGTFVTGATAAAGSTVNVVLTAVDSVGNASATTTVTGAILDTTKLTFQGQYPTMVNRQGKDTISAATSAAVFTLSESADSIRVTYRKVGAGGVKAVVTTSKGQSGGNPNINLTGTGPQRIDVTTDSLQDQTFYSLQLFGRDLAYNWTVTGPDTLFYNVAYLAPKSDTINVAVKSTSNDTVVADVKGAATGVVLTIAGWDTILKKTAITYNVNGIIVDVWSPDTTMNLAGVHIYGASGVTEQAALVGKVKRATLDNGGWLLGSRDITISDTLAQSGLYVTIRDTVSTVRKSGVSARLVFESRSLSQFKLMAADTSNVPANQPFIVSVQPQDKFGNPTLKQGDAIYASLATYTKPDLTTGNAAGNSLAEVWVQFSSNNADMGVPPGPQRISSTGWTAFQLVAPMTNGRNMIQVREAHEVGGATSTATSLSGSAATSYSATGAVAGTIYVWVTGGSGTVTPPPGGDPTVAKPDTLIVQDYKGPAGSGDQGGFVLVTFKNTAQHASLSQYRIWRQINVSTGYDATTGKITTLTAPVTQWVPWAVVDAVPVMTGAAPITRAVIPTIDPVATPWAITAEMGSKSSESATSTAVGGAQGKVVFSPESVKETLALLGINSILSSDEIANVFGPSYEFQAAILGDQKDLLIGRLDLDALRQVALRIPEGVRAQSAQVRASEATVAAAARAIDDIAPAAVTGETAAINAREVTLTWTASADDRVVGFIPYRGYAAPIAGVQTYDVFRGATDQALVKIASLASGSTTYKDVVSPDLGNNLVYRITATDLDNATSGKLVSVTFAGVGRTPYTSTDGKPAYLMVDPAKAETPLVVDFEDFFVFADSFGMKKGDAGFNPQTDVNDDGVVDFDDFFAFADSFGKSIAPRAAGKLVARATPVSGVNRDAGLNLNLGSERVIAGQQIKLDVSISNAAALKGYGFTLTYDPLKFELVEATAGDQNLLSQGGNTPVFLKNAQPGRIQLANAISGDGSVAGSGNLAQLVFNVKGEFDDIAKFEIAEGILVDGSRLLNPVVTLGALEIQTTPTEFALKQNFPNPFNPETTIKYALADGGNVNLRIYNMVGQVVRTLVNERQSAGRYSIRWDGKDDRGLSVSSGIYFYSLTADKFHNVKKLMLLK